MKKALLLTTTFILLSCIVFPTYWYFDALLQRAQDSLSPVKSIKSLQNGFLGGNIYWNAYTLAKSEVTSKIVQSTSRIAQDINGKYNCNVTINDVGNILLSLDSIRNDMQAALATISEQKTIDDAGAWFASSCLKAAQCVGKRAKDAATSVKGGLASNTQSRTTLSDEWYKLCRSVAAKEYQNNTDLTSTTTDLSLSTAWDDIYYNGTLDDSPYDLLVDIQAIGDVLFTENQKVTKTILYSFPNGSIAGFQLIPFSATDPYSTLGLSQNNGNPINNTSTSLAQWNNTTSWSQTSWWYTSTTWTAVSNDANGIPTDQSQSPQIATSTSDTTIQNYACVNNGNNGNSSIGQFPPIAQDTSDNTNTSSITPPELTADNGASSSSTVPFWPANSYYSPLVTSSDDPVSANTDRSDPDQFQAAADKIKSCTQKCDGLPAADKIMCVSKCMCWSASTKDGLFSLSICTVPAKASSVVSNWWIQSIQQIVEDINGVLLALKQSWQLAKNTKQKEMLDTSLNQMKLNKTFAFDINITTKPILDEKPRTQDQANKDNANDQISNGNFESIDIRTEKNKYLVLYNPIQQEAIARWGSTLDEINTNLKLAQQQSAATLGITEDAIKTLEASQNAVVADAIRGFIEQNIRFRGYTYQTLASIQQTADALRQKIEKGN